MRMLRTVPGHFLLVCWTGIVLVPFILITLLAFRPEQGIFAHPLGIGGGFTLNSFATAWRGPSGGTGLAVYLANSGIIAILALATNLVISSPAAFFATRLSAWLRRWFVRVFLIAGVVPVVLLVIPLFEVFDTLNLVNSPEALAVAYGVISAPTSVLVLHAFFGDFPRDLLEAGSIDGLGLFGTFLRIVLPLSRGAIVGVSLLALIFVWGEAQIGITILQSPDSQSVPVGMLGFQGQFTVQLGPIFAGLAIASIPIIIVYLAFHRSVTKGIALGGVFR